MSALRLAFMKRREKIKRSNSSNNNINMPAATATDDDIQLDHGNDNDNILFSTAANAFDHSPTVREYFHNNRSRPSLTTKACGHCVIKHTMSMACDVESAAKDSPFELIALANCA